MKIKYFSIVMMMFVMISCDSRISGLADLEDSVLKVESFSVFQARKTAETLISGDFDGDGVVEEVNLNCYLTFAAGVMNTYFFYEIIDSGEAWDRLYSSENYEYDFSLPAKVSSVVSYSNLTGELKTADGRKFVITKDDSLFKFSDKSGNYILKRTTGVEIQADSFQDKPFRAFDFF